MKNKKYLYVIITIVITLLLVCLIPIGGYFLYNNNNKEVKQKEEIKEIEEEIEEQEEVIEEPPYENPLPAYREEYSNNNIMGKLEIPGIGVETLVTRSEDNEFYLENSLYNVRDGLGVPFFDYRNIDLVNSKQINIYGHNTDNAKYLEVLPFVKLLQYKDVNVFNTANEILLSIDEKQLKYEVIGTKIVSKSNNEHMRVNFQTEDDFLRHTGFLLSDMYYEKDNLKIKGKDRLLVLQVCNYEPEDTLLLIIGREKK